jgi:hypothetical protein
MTLDELKALREAGLFCAEKYRRMNLYAVKLENADLQRVTLANQQKILDSLVELSENTNPTETHMDTLLPCVDAHINELNRAMQIRQSRGDGDATSYYADRIALAYKAREALTSQ